ncbi:hypothetical protein NDI52_30035 [Leptolyngbya sp. PL-A3]|uniref:hypothetical protein n=1 Tax=Leptolyngbya sp. PL-A3 TaxID=2933911 RepID=UPI003298CB23
MQDSEAELKLREKIMAIASTLSINDTEYLIRVTAGDTELLDFIGNRETKSSKKLPCKAFSCFCHKRPEKPIRQSFEPLSRLISD